MKIAIHVYKGHIICYDLVRGNAKYKELLLPYAVQKRKTAMKFQKQIDFLLNNACSSIKFLVYRDFLHTPLTEPFMQNLRADILNQENIKKHLECQHPDGWFGDELHGGEYGMERSIGTLLNAGVEREHPAIQKGIHALVTPEIAKQHKKLVSRRRRLGRRGQRRQ